jgi:glycosyltransferase involved in cell wall biosynthesis
MLNYLISSGDALFLVSILMASYNHEKYISEAIESVLSQGFKDFELIIVDDGSEDSSKRIIETYKKKDRRVQAFFHERNRGIAKTLNHCLAEAKGKYVAFIDSDDVWVESKLEKQLAILNNNDSIVVWSEGEIINEKGIPTGRTFTQMNFASNKKKSGRIFEELLDRNFIFGSSLMLKKEHLENIRFDEQLKYLNDYKFVVDLAEKHPFFYLKEPLAKYRIHGKNTILEWETANWAIDRILVKKYFLREYGKQIRQRKKADLLFEIGREYSSLNDSSNAKFYFFEAVKIYPFSWITLLHLIYFLTEGKGYAGKFLVYSFTTGTFFFIRSLSKLKLRPHKSHINA